MAAGLLPHRFNDYRVVERPVPRYPSGPRWQVLVAYALNQARVTSPEFTLSATGFLTSTETVSPCLTSTFKSCMEKR